MRVVSPRGKWWLPTRPELFSFSFFLFYLVIIILSASKTQIYSRSHAQSWNTASARKNDRKRVATYFRHGKVLAIYWIEKIEKLVIP
jgi:hypothetical protein